MIRLSRVLIGAGVVVTLAACSEMGPTAPGRAPAAAASRDLVVFSAALSGSCTVTQNGTDYDVTVTWSGISATRIELWVSGATQPLVQTILGHPTRKGSVTDTISTSPDYAQVTDHQTGFRTPCVTGT